MVLYDPLTHRYYDLRPASAALLALWHLRDPVRICAEAARRGLKDAQSTLDALARFLARHGLLQVVPANGFDSFHHVLAKENSFKARLGRMLFLRLRMGNPEPLLDWLQPLAAPLMTRGFRWLTLAAFVLALSFLIRQPEQLAEALRQTASLQGALGLLLALALVKLFHELGHAFQAKRLGLRVPGYGVLFMVGLPMPFTELSDTWRLPRARDRLRVDAGGILAELTIAAWASLAFVFWPDGPVRQVLFAMAGSSLAMSLMINLNPLMRFDGYFLLADATGVKNLQPRSLALAQWALRERLFGWGDPMPEQLPTRTRRRMIAYAVAVYLYRVFLTFSIAALILWWLPTAVGAPLAVLYVLLFLLVPIGTELRVWLSRRREALRRRQTWRSLLVFGALALLLCYPFAQTITVPARLTPQNWQVIASQDTATLIRQPTDGSQVVGGQVLWQFSDPALAFASARNATNQQTIQTQIERSASQTALRDQLPLLRSELTRLEAAATQLAQQARALDIRAPFDGQVILAQTLPQRGTALPLGPQVTLGYVLPPAEQITWGVDAYILGDQIQRLGDSPSGTFRADGAALAPFEVTQITWGRNPVDRIDHPEALEPFGGPLRTRTDDTERPRMNTYALSAVPAADRADPMARVVTGRLVLKGAPKSLLARTGQRIAQVLVQQAGVGG